MHAEISAFVRSVILILCLRELCSLWWATVMTDYAILVNIAYAGCAVHVFRSDMFNVTLLYVHRDRPYGLLETGSPGRPPLLSHSPWVVKSLL